jgi:unsaturated rhamnogalacturonyl hydrolase
MYGADLETWKKEPLVSSGVDVWCKRVRKLVVNDWYMTDNYHQDSGEGADLYSVHEARGCGGSGVWVGGKLYVSRNFTSTRVLANGPIRLVFELGYAPWEAGGMKISETKRITLDAGKSFDQFQSTFRVEGKTVPFALGVGIAKHEGSAAQLDKKAGWLRSWEPLKKQNGNLGCGIVVPPAAIADYKQTASDYLLITKAQAGAPITYYAGFGWDKSGDFADLAAWTKYVEGFSREVAAPLVISLSALGRTAAAAGAAATTTATARSLGRCAPATRSCDAARS